MADYKDELAVSMKCSHQGFYIGFGMIPLFDFCLVFFVVFYLFRSAPALSLGWTFLYLLFFRLVTWFGLPQPTPFANAIQLLLTLKVQDNKIRHIFHVLNS